jgi:hypothetical protein
MSSTMLLSLPQPSFSFLSDLRDTANTMRLDTPISISPSGATVGQMCVADKARDRRTGEIVALKKLRMDRERDGEQHGWTGCSSCKKQLLFAGVLCCE